MKKLMVFVIFSFMLVTNDEVLSRAFDKTDKEVLMWDNKTVERQNI